MRYKSFTFCTLIGHAFWVVLYPDFASAEGTFAGTLFTVSGFILWLRICTMCAESAEKIG